MALKFLPHPFSRASNQEANTAANFYVLKVVEYGVTGGGWGVTV